MLFPSHSNPRHLANQSTNRPCPSHFGLTTMQLSPFFRLLTVTQTFQPSKLSTIYWLAFPLDILSPLASPLRTIPRLLLRLIPLLASLFL